MEITDYTKMEHDDITL